MSALRGICIWITTLVCSASSAAEPDCVPQAWVDVATIDRQVVLIGEAHGTNEIPRFALGLVCSLLRAGKSVILGVEHSGEQQEGLNRYLRSNGTPEDRQVLLQGINWRKYSDVAAAPPCSNWSMACGAFGNRDSASASSLSSATTTSKSPWRRPTEP